MRQLLWLLLIENEGEMKASRATRIREGFHRIGLVFLVPAWIFAAVVFAFGGFKYINRVRGDPGPWEDFHNLFSPTFDFDFFPGIAAVVAGLALYVVAWAVGWIIAGFVGNRDE